MREKFEPVTDDEIRVVCPSCGEKVALGEAHVMASPAARTYSCPEDGSLLARIVPQSPGSTTYKMETKGRWEAPLVDIGTVTD